jgi:hypothetical protein
MNSILLKAKIDDRHLQSEKYQDYAQKPQRSCPFMNSAYVVYIPSRLRIVRGQGKFDDKAPQLLLRNNTLHQS